ncbi:transposon ty3-I gag-pol polyprotein [Tanacetum coccineum]
MSWPCPRSITDVRCFLGACQYLQKFIRHFSVLASPLHATIKLNTKFEWSNKHKETFLLLKRKINEAPVLALPNLQRPFKLETVLLDMLWGLEALALLPARKGDCGSYRPSTTTIPTNPSKAPTSSSYEMDDLLATIQFSFQVHPSRHDEYASEYPSDPNFMNESISMDFLGGLPKTLRGNDYLFVIVDRFSKMVVLIPCKKTVTKEEAARLFFENVWKIFGLPKSIISDRDSRFLKTWDKSIPFLQFTINHVIYSSTGKSPSKVCLGFIPQTPFYLEFTSDSLLTPSNEVGEVREAQRFINNIKKLHHQVEEQLRRSQQKYKERHDCHRVEGKFQEGDLVWLHLGKERLKVNVDKLKLFEPSMLDEEPVEYLPSLDELINEQEKVLTEDTIVERKLSSTRRGERKSYRI